MMKYLNILWRSLACLIVNIVGVGALMTTAIYFTPELFQSSKWGKIGVLAVGIEAGAFVLYFVMMLCIAACFKIGSKWKAPAIIGCVPIAYGIIRYPWWLIQGCLNQPISLGTFQWIIIIAWSATWVITLGISLGGLIGQAFDKEYKHSGLLQDECG